MPVSPDIARECSPFLDRLIDRHPGWFEDLQASKRLEHDIGPAADELAGEITAQGLEPGLRRFRNREMMRIIWRELNATASLEQTMADLSRLAELCLQAALDNHQARLAATLGLPRSPDGAAQKLVVLGLGKLGGFELNLSSDIDIVFCYPAAGQTDGSRTLANEQYFLRLARAVVKSLSEVTEDGFCFRVDTRLRPFGDSGPLVCSFGSMEQYYQREGRDWERYALIKARPVAGDPVAGEALLLQLKPFVYRRYIDFGAVEALQEMLASIHEDAGRQGRENDIKRGPGGIREIEFLVQCLQLLRGGREPQLQTPSLLTALDQLAELEVLSETRVDQLRGDYAFLRRLENAVQALHDQQTHELPGGNDLGRVATVLGCGNEQALLDEVQQTRVRVSSALTESFPQPPEPGEAAWDARLGDDSGPAMRHFRTRLARTALSQRATSRLNRFMPMLIDRLQAIETDQDVQRDVLELVLAITRRSAYLSLLVQNPRALDRMLELFRISDWIAATVIRHPALLDELIDPALGRVLPEPEEMQHNTDRIQAVHGELEAAIQALNYMQRAISLRIAVAELESTLDSADAQKKLTGLAEVLLSACLELAAGLIRERHGDLSSPGLAVIAYGTLGARDTSYGSDLDLIFLHQRAAGESDGERPLVPEQYYTRLARRMLGLATAATPAGRLYEIDTRLRPNGRAGLLVSSLEAFQRYQSNDAWVWELQALVRARPVAGDAEVAKRFEHIREEVLTVERNAAELQAEVAAMRQRMRAEVTSGDPFKHQPGGLVDIDFVAQLGVLQCAHRVPGLLRSAGTRDHLQGLSDAGWIDAPEATRLIATHEHLVRARQLEALSRGGAGGTPDTGPAWGICRRFLETAAP